MFLNAAAVRTAETYDPSVLCLVRGLEGEKLAAVFNFSGRAGTAWIKEEGEYLDLLSGETMTGEEVPVGPFQARWLLWIQNIEDRNHGWIKKEKIMASVQLKNVCKKYPNGYEAVKDFNLDIADKEFIIFVGPSGCGKSTTLRMVAGLEDISSGELIIDGKVMNDVEPKDRDIAMVFQSYALYPHMTVYDNMAFSLKLKKTPKEEIDKAVREAARILDLEKLLDRKPRALSGGQRQRVAMGRAIVRNPKVFLMDEPLSNLDAKLRGQMRVEISKLHQRLGSTIIYVTHDQTEAMTLGTRIVVMKDGVVQQIDTPQNLYDHPCNKFVAGFIGSPQMNMIQADAVEVRVYEMLGAEALVYFDIDETGWVASLGTSQKIAVGDRIRLAMDTSKIHIFDNTTEETITD